MPRYTVAVDRSTPVFDGLAVVAGVRQGLSRVGRSPSTGRRSPSTCLRLVPCLLLSLSKRRQRPSKAWMGLSKGPRDAVTWPYQVRVPQRARPAPRRPPAASSGNSWPCRRWSGAPCPEARPRSCWTGGRGRSRVPWPPAGIAEDAGSHREAGDGYPRLAAGSPWPRAVHAKVAVVNARLVGGHVQEPAEEHVERDLLAQRRLGSHRVQAHHYERPGQTHGRDARASPTLRRCIRRGARAAHRGQCAVGHPLDGPERMIRRHQLFEVDLNEDAGLVIRASAHAVLIARPARSAL